MYDELVKRLRTMADWTGISFLDESENVRINLSEAADAIEELMRRCEQFQYMPLPAWTPVTEGLPVERINPYTRDFEFVLCRTIWGDVRPFKYGTQIGQKKAHFWNGAGYVDAYVTHWMPLPEPPKEET